MKKNIFVGIFEFGRCQNMHICNVKGAIMADIKKSIFIIKMVSKKDAFKKNFKK